MGGMMCYTGICFYESYPAGINEICVCRRKDGRCDMEETNIDNEEIQDEERKQEDKDR